MARPFTVALDMDSTVYDLHTPWLNWLRDVHGEDTSEQFTCWDTHKQYTKTGVKCYDFLELPGAFYNLVPLPGAIEAIREVAGLGVRQFFISTCKTKNGAWEKQQAVKRDFPELAGDVLITSHNKDIIWADALVDDGPHNIEAFQPYGLTIKLPYAYNDHVDADFTMYTWNDYYDIIVDILKQRRKNPQEYRRYEG